MEILIATPLAVELKHLVDAFSSIGRRFEKQNDHYIDQELGLVCAAAGHGKVEFALGCQALMFEYPNAKRMISVGAAGALDDQLVPYDVVVGTQIIEHDYKVKFDTQAVLPTFGANEDLTNQFREIMAASFKVHFGPIASGDEDIMDLTRANEVRRSTKAIAVAWESAGFARACMRQKKEFIEIRGITDSCSGAVTESFKMNLPQAIENVALVINEGLFQS